MKYILADSHNSRHDVVFHIKRVLIIEYLRKLEWLPEGETLTIKRIKGSSNNPMINEIICLSPRLDPLSSMNKITKDGLLSFIFIFYILFI